ncbi:MAG: NINE protein [Bifidobacteriaceae bacterium]|jgi:TM2 domain-containing membrane protein YozV|nr:NINE protein [Bifidobacteriaceae bacterium]
MTVPPDPNDPNAVPGAQPNPYEQPSYPQPDYSQGGYEQPVYPQPGYAQPAYVAPNPNAKSKIAAGLLGIFLGSLGVHNFYLGRTGAAIAQLLISVLSLGFLAAVSGIWGLIEGIMILTAKPGTKWAYDAHGVPLE